MPFRIVIAPDSFKGTMTSVEVCGIVAQAAKKAVPGCETVSVPIADGGEGTVDAFLAAIGGRKIHLRVTGPQGKEVGSFYGILPDGRTAVVEMAAASGLCLTGPDRDPSETTTFGTGQLIRHALGAGCREFIVGIGGSATNDGGIGMAAALGARFLDRDGRDVPPTGEGLGALETIDLAGLDPRLRDCRFTVACDVANPLYGPQGAAHVFAPQKGADPATVAKLDANLRNYARVIRTRFGIDPQEIRGAGAAGGTGVALAVFLGASVKPGVDAILDAAGFDETLRGADLVITGEGKLDAQTLMGKVPVGVARRAKPRGVPVIAIVGQTEGDIRAIYDEGIAAVFTTLKRPASIEAIRRGCRKDLADAALYAIQVFHATLPKKEE